MTARATANTMTQYRVWLGRREAEGGAFRETGLVGGGIAPGMMGDPPPPGNLFLDAAIPEAPGQGWRIVGALRACCYGAVPYKFHTNSIQTPYKFHTNANVFMVPLPCLGQASLTCMDRGIVATNACVIGGQF